MLNINLNVLLIDIGIIPSQPRGGLAPVHQAGPDVTAWLGIHVAARPEGAQTYSRLHV